MYLFVRVPVCMRLRSQKKTFRSSVHCSHDVGSRTELSLSGLEASVSAHRAFTAFLGESSLTTLLRGIHPIRTCSQHHRFSLPSLDGNPVPMMQKVLLLTASVLPCTSMNFTLGGPYGVTWYFAQHCNFRVCLLSEFSSYTLSLPCVLIYSHDSPGPFRLFLFLLLDSPPLCLFILCIPSPSFTPVP